MGNPIKVYLVDQASNTESIVYYHKMSGDYYRYLAEFKKDKAKAEASQNAKEAYDQAKTKAEPASSNADANSFLQPTQSHPPWPRAQLLRLLLRDSQQARRSMQ